MFSLTIAQAEEGGPVGSGWTLEGTLMGLPLGHEDMFKSLQVDILGSSMRLLARVLFPVLPAALSAAQGILAGVKTTACG